MAAGLNREIAPLARVFQIAHRRRTATGVARGGLIQTAAGLGRAVEVGIIGQSRLLAGFTEGFAHQISADRTGDAERAADAVPGVRKGVVIFGFNKIALNIGK